MKILITLTALLCLLSAHSQDSTLNRYAVTVDPTIKPKETMHMKHEYGNFSISTNLTSLIQVHPYNRRMTIEPEFQLNDRWSFKVPFAFGVSKTFTQGQNYYYFGYDYYQDANFNINTVPSLAQPPYRIRAEDILFQTGVNPKYYFNGKSKNLLSFYGSLSFNVGIADQYSLQQRDRLDTTGYTDWQTGEYKYRWTVIESETEYISDQFTYFSHEILLGLDYNFSRRLSCTFEMGYASKLYGRPERTDQVYTAIFNNDYVVNFEGEALDYGRRSRPIRLRLLLTARF